MRNIQVKLITDSERSKRFVHDVIGRLDSNQHQVSIETQQLSSVGMMPDPNYQIIDVAKMSLAQAIRVYQDAKDHVGKSSKYVLIKDEEHETIQERIDRETLSRSLKDLGADVFETKKDMALDIQEKYNELAINVTGV